MCLFPIHPLALPLHSCRCCAGAKAFNDAKCSCSPPVLELVKGFTGGSTSTYAILAQWLADKCKFPLIFGPGKC